VIERVPIVRVSVANIKPKALAERLSGAGIDATVWKHWGASRKWGGKVETGSTFESNDLTSTYNFTLKLLRDLGEDAAYAVEDGSRSALWYKDGAVTRL
jgi:hypothetical protein